MYIYLESNLLKNVFHYTICGIDTKPETLILSSYPTNRYLCMGLRRLASHFIAKNYQLFQLNSTSHKKVL